MAILATAPSIAVEPPKSLLEVISVSGFSSNALNPLPRAFLLLLISNVYYFIFLVYFGHFILLQNFSRKVQIIYCTLRTHIVHNYCLSETRSFSKFCISLNDGIE